MVSGECMRRTFDGEDLPHGLGSVTCVMCGGCGGCMHAAHL